ncbi:MAG: EAL domain-containing protein [Rhizobiales bacterium]|nr:EAL domain-containing protein [Hyphomicrobiales bacterium]
MDRDNPTLVLAQLRAFSKQIPLLYAILIANTAFVSLTHFGVAPFYLTVLLPGFFCCIAALRLSGWWRMRKSRLTVEQAARRLTSTVYLAGALGIGFTFWGFALFPYGDVYMQSHVIFYMALTMIACVFSLMNLRAAAYILSCVVIVPFLIFFSLQGHMVLTAIAANMALVTAVMLFILTTHSRDFALMVSQREYLEAVNRETQRLSDDNRKLAHHDSLTGLPNRRSFIAQAEARVNEHLAGSGRNFALGIVDLDGFKAVNDLYGHSTGDALLVEASRRMRDIAGPDIIFARLGGDEFGIIAGEKVDLPAFGRTLCEVLRQPYELQDVTAEVTSSCGFAEFGDHCSTTHELFEHADYALYQAKDKAGGQTVVFSAAHRDSLRQVHEIDQALRNADIERELALVYQPVVDTRTGRLASVEALARWRNESLGSINPAQFIAAAEKTSLINRITNVLLRKLLLDLGQWPSDLTASFNLSARSLASPDAMLQIVNIIQRSGVDPRRIEIEVTETALMIDFEAAQRSLVMLRNLGVRIALDDFGTGYSSLSHVHELALDKIKIDRKFVGDMSNSPKAASVVRTVIDLCGNLSLVCVAEGVETVEQADSLGLQGCHLVQGFLYGRPVPARDVAAMYVARRPGPGRALPKSRRKSG